MKKNLLIFTLLFLSVFSYPLISYSNEQITIFDVLITILTIYTLAKFIVVGEIRFIFKPYLLGFFFIFIIFMFLRLLFQPYETYSILFVIKNLEYLCIFFVVGSSLTGMNSVPFIMFDITLFSLSTFQLFNYFVLNTWYRISLPFKSGDVSPNPAGFVLTLFLLIYMYELINGNLKFYQKLILISGFVSLILTFSRTNTILFVLVSLFMFFTRIKLTFKRFAMLSILGTCSVILNNIVTSLIGDRLKYGKSFASYIVNPSNIINDYSMQMRLNTYGIFLNHWISTFLTFLFGNGIGFIPVMDSTFFSLLVNMGIVGFTLFFIAWYFGIMLNFYKNKMVLYMLLFAFLNGFTVETLLVSYRTVQVYIVILLIVAKTFSQRSIRMQSYMKLIKTYTKVSN